MTLKLVLKTPNNRIILSDRIASFVLEKEAYTPYSQLRIVVYGALEPELYAQVYRVQLLLDETELHLGTVEQCQTTRQQGIVYIQIVSRGLTAMLLQNQLTPGLHSGMSLDRLMTGFYSFPQEITWERSTDASNYLYVKENTSMWDGLANLSYKLYERYPLSGGRMKSGCICRTRISTTLQRTTVCWRQERQPTSPCCTVTFIWRMWTAPMRNFTRRNRRRPPGALSAPNSSP